MAADAHIEVQAPKALANERVEDPPLLVGPNEQPIRTLDGWEAQRAHIEADWLRYLGRPPFGALGADVRVEREDDWGDHTGTLLALKTEPDYYEQCYLMRPKPAPAGRMPAVVVFFYDVDTPSGHNMGSHIWKDGNETRQFARHLVDRGYVVLAQRWFYEGYAITHKAKANPGVSHPNARFTVIRQQQEAPDWKGLGHVIWDARRCVDYLQTLDFVDPERIGCMGHSLGGKMALYAAAFDRRFQCVVSSEPGIGLSFSNWEDPWYLGPEAKESGFGRDHHQLLGLIAPRPFLLIGGESADGDQSWPYLNSAQDVYRLYDAPDKIGMYNHRMGHSPTMPSCEAAYAWMDKTLKA